MPSLRLLGPVRGSGLSLSLVTHEYHALNVRVGAHHAPPALGQIVVLLATRVFGWSVSKSKQSCKLFWESTVPTGAASNTIAFNHTDLEVLYFNAWFFSKYEHGADWERALAFWYMTFCHELAHNKERGHTAGFARVMGEIFAMYLPRFRRLPAVAPARTG
jgi:hypothetical protein